MTTIANPLHEQLTAEKVELIELETLNRRGLQLRVEMNADAISRYAEVYLAGEQLPPIVVFHETIDGTADMLHLADGHHRVAAARKAKITELPAIIKQGDRRAAILYAAAANGAHGLPLGNADKRRIVETLLADSEWREWSNCEIARHARVSEALIRKVRKEVGAEAGAVKTKAGKVQAKRGSKTTKAIGEQQQISIEDTPAPTPPPVELTGPEDISLSPANSSTDISPATALAAGRALDLSNMSPATAAAMGRELARNATSPGTAVEPAPPTPPKSLEQRRLEKQREIVHEHLLRGKPQWRGDDKDLFAIALICGVPTRATAWCDAVRATSRDTFIDVLRTEIGDRIRSGEQLHRRWPDLRVLCHLWGLDFASIEILAERFITE